MAQFPNRLAARAHLGVAAALRKIAELTTRVEALEGSTQTGGAVDTRLDAIEARVTALET